MESVSTKKTKISEIINEPPTKKVKKPLVVDSLSNSLANFIPNKLLSINTDRKTITILGQVNEVTGHDNDDASGGVQGVLILEKTAFTEAECLTANAGYLNDANKLKLAFVNDIYHKFDLKLVPDLNVVKTTLIYPATDKHIRKYSYQPSHLIDETPELYRTVTLPHVEKEQFTLDWVYNVLEHKAEVERIVYEDTHPEIGFTLLHDLHWNGTDKESLHIVCLVHARGIKSIRDLNERHLELLRNIRDKGTAVINEKFAIKSSQLRVFFHYQPSFYHLHVHFTSLRYDAPGAYPGRAHLLTQVINNIELVPDYYQRATIPFSLRELDNLFSKYQDYQAAINV